MRNLPISYREYHGRIHGTKVSIRNVKQFFKDNNWPPGVVAQGDGNYQYIKTPFGIVKLEEGDWILEDKNDEYWVYRPRYDGDDIIIQPW